MKKLCLFIILIGISCCLIGAKPIEQHNTYEQVPLGIVEETPKVIILGNHVYKLYKLKDNLYITLSTLSKMGVTSVQNEEIYYLEYPSGESEKDHTPISLKDEVAVMNKWPIYCGNLRSYCLKVGEELLIPIETLNTFWSIEEKGYAYIAKPYWSQIEQNIRLDEKSIQNVGEYTLQVDFLHLFWNGKEYIEEWEKEVLLAPGEKMVKNIQTKEMLYITTIVTRICDFQGNQNIESCNGQRNSALMSHYEKVKRMRYLDKLFPKYRIKGIMKYSAGPFKEKEEVELWRVEKRAYYIVKGSNGKKVQIPWNSINIVGDWGTLGDNVTNQDIEDFVTFNEIASETDYILWTDVYRQRTYVLKKQDESWHLEKKFVCSTGKNINPTPTGLYKIEYAFPYFGESRGFRCKNALVFYRDYMYHSILFDKTGKYVKSGKYELGHKASHGCIRLSEADSEWLYKNIPVKTTVWIR